MDNSLIGFCTDGSWIAEDLATLPRAASRIYDVFSSSRICSRLVVDWQTSNPQRLKLYTKELKGCLPEPDSCKFDQKLERLVTKALAPPPAVPMSYPTGLAYFHYLRSPGQVLSQIAFLASPSERLAVAKATMASPIGFVFTGLAEINKEFRELSKDLWYRNSQE